MSDPKTYFSTKEHAAGYKTFRLPLPENIVKKITAYLAQKFELKECTAVDVGCGSGQSTFPIAKHVGRVVGVEPSEAQLAELKSNDVTAHNVEFRLGSADHLPLDSSSVHLVYAVEAIHWFDQAQFFREVDRVLVNGGVLAVANGVHSFEIAGYEQESRRLLDEFESRDSKSYWDWSRIQLTINLLESVVLPYAESERDTSLYQEHKMSVAFFIGRIKTSSGNAKFLKEKPEEAEEAFKILQDKFLKMVGSSNLAEDTIITVRKRHVLLLSRKP